MKLILIRHLPTEFNRLRLLQGRRDEPIALPSADVLSQIRENRKILDTMPPFDAVIASSLRRTVMTAKHYGFADPIRDSLLDELDFGPFEGRPRADLMAEDGNAWLENPYQSLLCEFVRDLESRVRQFVAIYSVRNTVLGFAHGSWIRALLSVLRHGNVADMNRFDVPNNSLTVLEVMSEN